MQDMILDWIPNRRGKKTLKRILVGHLTGTEYGEWTVTTDSLRLRTVLQLCILSTLFLRRCTLRSVCGEKVIMYNLPSAGSRKKHT